MSGELLFGRRWRVTLHDVAVDANRVRFRVTKSLRLEPNTAEVTVYNLSRDTRTNIAIGPNVGPAQCVIEAGHVETMGRIFGGDIVGILDERDGPDRSFSVRAGDGERALREAFTSAWFPPQTTLSELVGRMAADMKLKPGNLVERLQRADMAGFLHELQRGLAMHEHSALWLENLARLTGLRISVQDGEIVALKPAEASTNPAIEMSAETGLQGTPRQAEDGTWIARGILDPDALPGRGVLLRFEGRQLETVIERVIFDGDSSGGPWTHTAQLRALDSGVVLPAAGGAFA